MKNILFYSGNGNHKLGADILRCLKKYIGLECKFSHTDFSEFPDEEQDDTIPKYEEIKARTVVFYQSIYNQKYLEEALQLIWAIKKRYGAAYLIAIIPFLIFRRQDHDEKLEEICRLEMIIDRLRHAGVDEIITISPHSSLKMNKFCNKYGITLHEADPAPLFATTVKTYFDNTPVIYSPDEGSIARAVELARLTSSQVIFSLKKRGLNNQTEIKTEETDEINRIIDYYRTERNFSEIYYADEEHIKEKFIVMIEDEVSTGGTANKTALRLRDLGAIEILLIASNPVLVRGWRRRLFDQRPFVKVILGDTIPRDYEKTTNGLIHDISFAEPIAQTVYKVLASQAKKQ